MKKKKPKYNNAFTINDNMKIYRSDGLYSDDDDNDNSNGNGDDDYE